MPKQKLTRVLQVENDGTDVLDYILAGYSIHVFRQMLLKAIEFYYMLAREWTIGQRAP